MDMRKCSYSRRCRQKDTTVWTACDKAVFHDCTHVKVACDVFSRVTPCVPVRSVLKRKKKEKTPQAQ